MIYEKNTTKRDTSSSSDKPRLFIDMDGTLAEWRNITLNITSDEEREYILSVLNEILLTPGYYSSLKPHEEMVEAVKILSKEYDVYILSCAIEKKGIPSPVTEKEEWLDKYMPDIKKDHRIFVPDGKNKADYIPGGIRPNDFLLDDYTKNLKAFEKSGGCGIKVNNYVNGNNGRWTGSSVSISYAAEEIAQAVHNIVTEGLIVNQAPPEKNRAKLEIDKSSNVQDILDHLNLEEK